LFQLTLSNNKEELNKKLEQLEIALNEKERALTDKKTNEDCDEKMDICS